MYDVGGIGTFFKFFFTSFFLFKKVIFATKNFLDGSTLYFYGPTYLLLEWAF